jgi:hypothetical protein
MTKTIITKILKLADAIYDISGKELRTSLTVGKNLEIEYKVWLLDYTSTSLPDIKYLIYDERGLIEYITELLDNLKEDNNKNLENE